MTKRQLGQFFTVNSDYVLNGLKGYIKGKSVCDPFAGSGELLAWAKRHGARKISGFDVDPQMKNRKYHIAFGDSLLVPKSYRFVITNPPYLNINKASFETKQRYFSIHRDLQDLYQISLQAIMRSEEGIIIVPINFLSAENAERIRLEFLDKFEIPAMNYFEEQVFPDTTYNVIAFYYRRKRKPGSAMSINTKIFPSKAKTKITIKQATGWRIGADQLEKINSTPNFLGAYRLQEKHMERGPMEIPAAYNHIKNRTTVQVSENLGDLIRKNILLLKSIDSGSKSGEVALEDIRKYGVSCLVSKPTSRHMIQIIFEKDIPIQEQERLIHLFNETIGDLRKNTFSLFLTNYRDKGRKRVSFEFAYRLLNHLYYREFGQNYFANGSLFRAEKCLGQS